jgi:hypothetical protein
MLTSIWLVFTLLSAECPRGTMPAVPFGPLASLAPPPSNPGRPPFKGGLTEESAGTAVPTRFPAERPARSPATVSLPRRTVGLSPLPIDEPDPGSYVPTEAVDEDDEEEGSEDQEHAHLDLAEADRAVTRIARLGSSPAPHPSLLVDRRRSTRGPPPAAPSA